MLRNPPHIVAAGAALADVLVLVDDAFLSSRGFVKGSRQIIKRSVLHNLLDELEGRYTIVPGGSASNTIIGAAYLGLKTAFAAKCGRDHLSRLLCDSMAQCGVKTDFAFGDQPTGICLSLVTPDGERTMLVDLAASDALTFADVAPDFFHNAGIAHFEAYMVSSPELMLNLLERAVAAGCMISLDLGSHNIICAHFDFIRRIITDYVDILIGNYLEGMAFTGFDKDEDILRTMRQNTAVAALKKGAQGSIIAAGADFITVAPVNDAERLVIDTTGAGDLWNSGFLYGLAQGYDPATAGGLASICGFEVCCVMGAQIQPQGWQRVHEYMAATGLTAG